MDSKQTSLRLYKENNSSYIARVVYRSRPLKLVGYLMLLLNLTIANLNAQSPTDNEMPPIPIEIMFSANEINSLTILNRPFGGASKFGYFGVVSVKIPYQREDGNNEIVLTNSLTYSLSKEVFALGGLQFHYAKGIVPYVGFQYFKASPTLLILINPNFQLEPTINLEGVGVVEYKPAISKKISLYTRFQALYNQNFDTGEHERSFLYFRLGITRKKSSFGLGINVDFYGAETRQEEDYGIFINRIF